MLQGKYEVYFSMEKYSGLVQQVLLTTVIGVVSIGVGFVGDLSKSVQSLSISVQELNIKMGQVYDMIKDHEVRLRHIETRK